MPVWQQLADPRIPCVLRGAGGYLEPEHRPGPQQSLRVICELAHAT